MEKQKSVWFANLLKRQKQHSIDKWVDENVLGLAKQDQRTKAYKHLSKRGG